MKSQSFLGTVLVCLFFLPAMALAQVTASVVGTVQDTSGAMVPGVAVTVKNLETGATRAVTTDDRGSYRALSLPVGRYEVTAEKAGFKRQVRTGITLVVNQEAVVNLGLEVGEVQQEVTVTAEAPIINTTTASTSGLVGEKEVKDLPLEGRSFDNLITLNPGATGNATGLRTASSGKVPGNLFNISGRRAEENLFLLNGIEYTSASLFGATPGGASGQLLGIDAVREFNVQSTTYGAEYGKRVGGQINVVTQSGTNQFHGTVFEFLRNSALDAANFFTNKGNQTIPPFRRNDFGGAAGGPIQKDKTFIFGNYEGVRQRLTTTVASFVPDLSARAGLLPCKVVTPAPANCPASGLVNVTVAPGMSQYFALYPTPNGPEQLTNGLPSGIAEAFNSGLNPVREDFGIVRVDHLFSEKDALGGAYTIDDGSSLTPGSDPFNAQILTLRSQVASLEETHTFSPTVINTARIGFSRGSYFTDSVPTVPLPASISIIAGRPMGQVLIGGAGVAGGSVSTYGSIAVDQAIARNLFTYSDSLQMTKGRHLISLGGWFQRVQLNELFISSAYGGVTFGGLQQFLAGQAASVSGTFLIAKRYSRQWEGAWYATDTFKATQRLTLTLGVRHEFNNGWNVGPAGQPANYVMGTTGCLASVAQCVQLQPTTSSSMYSQNNAKFLFGPRVGLAWDPFGKGKTSVHAGWGMYFNQIDDLTYAIAQPSSFALGSTAAPVQFPFQIVPGTPLVGSTPRIRGVFPPDAKTPTLQAWNLTVEQQLTSSTMISVGYVGSHGYRFFSSGEVNPTNSVICPASPCPATYPAGATYYPSAAQTARLNPLVGSSAGVFQQFVDSSYNSLQIDLRQRVTKGLTFRANYSFSKALDDSSVLLGGVFSNCPSGLMNPMNPIGDYGRSCYDNTHRFNFNGSYDLPFGQGKSFLSGATGVANKVVSGWKLNGIVAVQTGMPFTPFLGFGNARNGATGGTERPSWNPNFTGPVIVGTANEWYNPNAFIAPPVGTYGNMGRNVLTGPGLSNVDMSLFKNTQLSEKINLEFRAEIFNLFNHPNFSEPNTTVFSGSAAVYSGTAGAITSTLSPERIIQFGLKLKW